MKQVDTTAEDKEVSVATKWSLIGLVGLGLLLIFFSVVIQRETEPTTWWVYLSEFIKELGIVILAVFTVSLMYELLIAKKYVNQFLRLLHAQIEQGESNGAVCANLGIIQIYPTRDILENKYPFRDLVSRLRAESKLRIVGQSLLYLMRTPEALRTAIQQGAHLELCIFDPADDWEEIAKHPDLLRDEIKLSISLFERDIEAWLKVAPQPGSVELRLHRVLIFDSYLVLEAAHQNLAMWDWGFGTSLTDHRMVLLDPQKPLGKNLAQRYCRIWDKATVKFKYEPQKEQTVEGQRKQSTDEDAREGK